MDRAAPVSGSRTARIAVPGFLFAEQRSVRLNARMPLTMRPTWPTHDWTVFDDGAEIGRIYEDTAATHMRWFWTLGGKAGQAFEFGLVGAGRTATVEEAVAAFRLAYEQWLAVIEIKRA
jgi:hypothetical protein